MSRPVIPSYELTVRFDGPIDGAIQAKKFVRKLLKWETLLTIHIQDHMEYSEVTVWCSFGMNLIDIAKDLEKLDPYRDE